MTERDAAAQQPGRGQGPDADAPATRTGAGSAAGGEATSGRAATSGSGTPAGGRGATGATTSGSGTPAGGAGATGAASSGGRGSSASDRGGTGAGPEQAGRPATGSRLGWVALTVTVLLLVWQVVYGLTVAGPGLDTREAYTSVWLLISLVLGVGAAVLGIVAASQRVAPRWPATTALAVGSYVFLVCIATWAGNLISGTP